MTKTIRFVLGIVLIVPLLLSAPLAVLAATPTPSSTSAQQQQDTANAAANTQQAANIKKTLAQRVAAIKATYKSVVTAQQAANIKSKCATAQTAVSSVSNKLSDNIALRADVYNSLLSNLDSTIAKLKNASVPSTDLTAERNLLNSKIAGFSIDAASYKLSLSDLRSLDCASDPVAFQAVLEAARGHLTVISADATGIRQYVTDTIEPTLKLTSQGLSSAKTSGGQ